MTDAFVIGRLSTDAALSSAQPPPSRLGALGDVEAIRLYLDDVATRNERTAREYARELSRFLAWLEHRGVALRALTFVDLKTYFALVGDEQALLTVADEISRLHGKDASDRWETLFAIGRRKQRGAKAIGMHRASAARTVIGATLRWLAESGHLALIAVPRLATQQEEQLTRDRIRLANRKLPNDLWTLVDRAIEGLSWDDPAQATDRAMVTWLRWSGVRRGAFYGAMTDHVRSEHRDGKTYWFWRIKSKGGRVRDIPMNEVMRMAYQRYALSVSASLGEWVSLEGGQAKPLFTIVTLQRGEPHRAANSDDLYAAVKRIAARAAELAVTDVDKQRLLDLTPHWFRHRRAFELEAKHPLSLVAQFLGHASVATTQIYSSADEIELAQRVYGEHAVVTP